MSARAPLATVAMVARNSERFIATAIGSVLAQDVDDFELVVLDDASTDGTWDEIRKFQDRRIRMVRHESNLGEYANRNRAIALARGTYVMFIDADDYLYPHGLRTMIRALEAFPDAAFAIARPPSEKFIYPVELSPREFLACQLLGPPVIGRDFTQLLFRTEPLRACGGFDLRYRSGDTHIQFVLGARASCVLTGDGVAWWRRYAGQASETLLAGRLGTAELTRYGCAALEDPGCVLPAPERRIARSNLARAMMRTVAHFAVRGRLIHAGRLFRRSGLGFADCRFLFARERRPYLADAGGGNPIGPSRSPSRPDANAVSPRGEPMSERNAKVMDRV